MSSTNSERSAFNKQFTDNQYLSDYGSAFPAFYCFTFTTYQFEKSLSMLIPRHAVNPDF